MWAEEAIIDECAEEFSETSQMLDIAEDICGPYVWKTYDLLVLPPSFPYGGMENPCLTFITPTLLVRYFFVTIAIQLNFGQYINIVCVFIAGW